MNEGVPDTRPLDLPGPGLAAAPLRIGLVGLGRWGRNYLKTLLALTECRLVAMADADAATRARTAGETGIKAYESANELLSDSTIDAVVVATPDHTHCRLASAALKTGHDVLVEKPMTLTTSEAETLVRQAEDGQRILAVGHTAVYTVDIESLRVRLNALPRVEAPRVVAERTSSGPSAGQSSIANRQSPILFDLCPHDIALAALLFGLPVAARASLSRSRVEYEIRFADDALLAGRAEWCRPPHIRRFEFAAASEPVEPAGTGLRPAVTVRHSPLGRQCLDFIECCRTRQQPLSNGRLGLTVIRCISALAASSADSNAWVPLLPELHGTETEPRVPDPEPRASDLGVRV